MPTEIAKRVLVVDDQPEVAETLKRALSSMGCDVDMARDGVEALAKLRLGFDLILLDADMPLMDGFEVAQQVRQDPEFGDLPILMVTGQSSRSARLRAVEAGVNDFIAKPCDLIELRVRSTSLLKSKEAADELKRRQTDLEHAVASRTADLRRALDEMVEAQRNTQAAHVDTIHRLVLAAEYKDHEVGAHIERIGIYSALLGQGLDLAPHEVELLRYSTPMHDVGKIGIPDGLLLKPGKLDDAEWAVMKQHTTMGARLLHGSISELLQMGELVALTHHEHWDGTGYPSGIAGEAIPLFGRICAIADVFDALTTHRPYRVALPNSAAYEMMESARGRQFDPRLLDIFFSQRSAVEATQRELQDRP